MSNDMIETSHELVAQIVGPIEWLSNVEGLCACPGREMHTGANGKRDCKIYLGGVPTLTCFHSSCKSVIDAKNGELRRALRDGTVEAGQRVRLTVEEKAGIAEIQRKELIRKRAANSAPTILRKFQWTYQQILNESPVRLNDDAAEHWGLLLRQFKSEDVVWIGGTYDSGKAEHADHFRTVQQWQSEAYAPGLFVCPAVFKNTSVSRSNDNVIARRFLVVESDTLSRDEVGAVFKWLRDEVKLPLVAIVDTAGKSLHGWFVYPPDHVLEELKLILPELGCDPALFKASQPVRLPGAVRDGKYQKLVYLTEVAQ